MPRPNILFIMTDDHAAHAMRCYGSRINQTPNLDRITLQSIPPLPPIPTSMDEEVV